MNQNTRKYTYLGISCVFWFGHFLRSEIKSKSSFLVKKCYIMAVLNFFEAFCPKKWHLKKLFLILFSKSDLVGGGQICCQNCYLKKPKPRNRPKF